VRTRTRFEGIDQESIVFEPVRVVIDIALQGGNEVERNLFNIVSGQGLLMPSKLFLCFLWQNFH